MQHLSRRETLRMLAAASGAAVGASVAVGGDPPPKQGQNVGPAVESTARPESCGPREMFAVVDAQGNLQRGLHVVSARRIAQGIYEVILARDVRRGVYLATLGGHGFVGLPIPGSVSTTGLARNPRGVLVYTTNTEGDGVDIGFHLLVMCPEGYA